MRNNFRRKRKKKLNTKHIFLIIILFLFAISISYAMYTTQLTINGTATGEQEQLSILYINMENSSSYPDTIGYMDTYSYTFTIPPVIQSITMGGNTLVLNTDYTYTNGTLTIPNVTGNLVIQGDSVVQNVNVIFNDNNGNTNTVTVAQGQTVNKPQDPTKPGYGFLGWVDSNDAYFDFTTPVMADITLYAKWMQGVVAEINGTYYQTLQDAIDDVPTTNTETIIKLLTNISENVTIAANKNIDLNLQSFTLSNVTGGAPITNNGKLKIHNGNIQSSGTFSCLDNFSTGEVLVTGGRIVSVSGERAAIYNLGGRVEISGDAFLSSTARGSYNGVDRGTIQNYSGGVVVIKGGTIEGTNALAVSNAGSLTIGVKGDGTVSKTSPSITGKTYGVKSTTNFNFYDGVVKGRTEAFFDDSLISDIETGYNIFDSTEIISGATYKTAHLGIKIRVTFDANGGTVSETERDMEKGTKIGSLPTPTRTDYIFEGWFTSADGGTEVTADTIITQAMPIYAHWGDTHYAEINGTKYLTIYEAVTAVPTNTQTTIKVLKDIELGSTRISIPANKNIVLDIQSHTINISTDNPAIENAGTLTIQNGTIRKSGKQAAVNNNGGTLNVAGVNIIATGNRQGIYNDGGTTTISGSSNISAASTERAAVQNHNGTINILGGTITSSGFSAVVNESGKTMNIGTKDGNINTNSPTIQGADYGVKNSGTLKFYDGTIKGVTNAISGSVNDKETNSQIVTGTETISGTTYHTAHLEITP